MAFELLPFDEHFHVDILKTGRAVKILTRIGRDPERKTQYFAQVGLEPVPAADYFEYYFCLVSVCRGSEEFLWSGLDTPRTISSEDRKKILNIVCSMTRSLLDRVKPQEVMRITRDGYSGDAGLEKHLTVCVVFEHCGYEVRTTDVFSGKRIWMMKRLSSSE